MNESIKKITVLIASVLTALGLSDWAGIFDFLSDQYEVVITAITTIIAVATALVTKVKEAANPPEADVF